MTSKPNIKIKVETASADLEGIQSVANIAMRIFHEYCHEVGITHEQFEDLIDRCGPSVFQMVQACGEMSACVQLQLLAKEAPEDHAVLLNKVASGIAVGALDMIQEVQNHLPTNTAVHIMSVGNQDDDTVTTTLSVNELDEDTHV